MSFGRNLTIALYDKKMSGRELAEKIGVSKSLMAKYVNDVKYPSVPKLMAISSVLHISMDELLLGDLEKVKK